jgi:aryl-alcohol dehydrogenase-like predicted oxidoreductase
MRKEAMARAIRNIAAKGRREELVVVLQSYSRSAALLERLFLQGLKRLKLERADVLLLGWHNRRPAPKILERAQSLREKGYVRFLALSGHNRPLFPALAAEKIFDILHVRYNAAHRGAEEEVFAKLAPGEAPLAGADCYRFVLANPTVDVCMTGPSTLAEMREALRALELGPPAPEEMARIRRIGDHVHARHRRFFG